ncbi:MAG: hypothetical protein AAGF88_05135 [Pseudomonadota bacterium]
MRLSATHVLSIGGLCALSAVIGLAWGRSSLPPSETDVITAMAARYVQETGGSVADCLARPGPAGQAWITIYCDGAAGRFAYPVNRRGQLIAISETSL